MSTTALPLPSTAFLNEQPSAAPDALRAAITAATRTPEPQAVAALLPVAQTDTAQAAATQALALKLAGALRERKRASGRAGLVQGLLQQFALSSQEGVALMCLAEALLRIPDAATRDALIRDKVAQGQWKEHVGQSPSLFVNAAAWGLLITGKLLDTHSEVGLGSALTRLIGRGGEPLVRKAVDMAMRMMGEQFVTGETIQKALTNARPHEANGFAYSYDMLGEAALTADDAERYFEAYASAIDAIGRAAQKQGGKGPIASPGISIKLSALHPRYSVAQRNRVMTELVPRVLKLAEAARNHDIGLNIDAEEADRLELSLDILQALCEAPSLAGWNGIGFVIQAYQKRCPFVIDWIVALARRTNHRLMVRLVKGAYWDSEIKRAQVDGLSDYPVYTRKVHTDVSYLACARKLLAAPDAVFPQFATHNAHTVAPIVGAESLPDGSTLPKRPCRIYAPVGTHETLLAYLVRRLLENGANTSFVNRVADANVPLAELVQDPVAAVQDAAAHEGVLGAAHPRIALPVDQLGADRQSAAGFDLTDANALRELGHTLRATDAADWRAAPMLATAASNTDAAPVRNPATRADVVGHVHSASPADIEAALAAAHAFAPTLANTPPADRAAWLRRAADAMLTDMPLLMGLLVREAGKTHANAVAEVREAVDFLRYDAAQISTWSVDTHRPLGPVVCISPWNFPLAIFTGQVAAAIAAGNPVLAKPAEQTPLVAAEAVRILHAAGVPTAALQLLPGDGPTVGAPLVADARVQGVLFTGSTEVARILQRTVAQRLSAHGQPVTLIAETGGQNAMIVDSSALTEQVVQDAVSSAFDSAGQRCSALRVLCVQDDVADRTLAMLRGAMAELRVADPMALSTDVGPVIDAEAQAGIVAHIERLRALGHRVHQGSLVSDATSQGTFVPPTLIEIDRLDVLQREVFGPVLHVLRYRRDDLDNLLTQIERTGYGLTMGLHTRIDETVARVCGRAHVGNLYVNRNTVGAVVGVQPFGGEGLSGTGPKAGGPLYLLRLLSQQPAQAAGAGLDGRSARPIDEALDALRDWAHDHGDKTLATTCTQLAAENLNGHGHILPGPTGEANRYSILGRERVLCIANTDAARLQQLAAALAVGAHAVWPTDASALRERLPAAVQARIVEVSDWRQGEVGIDAALVAGDADTVMAVQQALANRPGPIVGVTAWPQAANTDATHPLLRLVHERCVSVNTTAAGGNASLMTMG